MKPGRVAGWPSLVDDVGFGKISSFSRVTCPETLTRLGRKNIDGKMTAHIS